MMGKKKVYTEADASEMIELAYNNGVHYATAKAEQYATAESESEYNPAVTQDSWAGYGSAKAGTEEDFEPEHGSYTLTVRYKHTKYAGEDTDFTTSLAKELAEDEFRFVTDHFDVLAVEVTDDSTWAN